MRLSQPRYGYNSLLSSQAVTATDVVYLVIRGVPFRVSSAVLGLFPDSVLMALFPTGIIPFYSVVTGRETATTVAGLRVGAATAAISAVTQALERLNRQQQASEKGKAKKETDPPSTRPSTGDTIRENEEIPTTGDDSFAAGGDTLSKSGAMHWQKHYNSEANTSEADTDPEEEDMESLSESISNADASDHEIDRNASSDAPLPTPHAPSSFPAAEHSQQTELTGVADHKICHIHYDAKLFEFLLNYFCQVVVSNHEAMINTERESRRVPEDQRRAENSAAQSAAQAGTSLGKVDEHAEQDSHPDADTAAEQDAATELKKSSGAVPAANESGSTSKSNSRRPSSASRRPSSPINLLRRVSGLKLSIVTFFANPNSGPTTIGPQATPAIPSPANEIARPVRTIIVLREELEYFPVPVWGESIDAGKGTLWETLKLRMRKSFSRAGRRLSIGMVQQKSTETLPKQGDVVQETQPGSVSDLIPGEVNDLKLFCGERLVKERGIARKFAEEGIALFEKTENERPDGTTRAPLSPTSATSAPPSPSKINSPQTPINDQITPTDQKTPRERVVCEMEEQIMKSQLISALALFSGDFTEGDSEWDFREIETGKCRVSSVSMLKMKDMTEIQKEMESALAAGRAASAAASSLSSPNTSSSKVTESNQDVVAAGKSSAGNSASLMTQVQDTNPVASVSTHHLNQHLALKRPVRKCWWEMMTIRLDHQWVERRRSSVGLHDSRMPHGGRDSSFGGKSLAMDGAIAEMSGEVAQQSVDSSEVHRHAAAGDTDKVPEDDREDNGSISSDSNTSHVSPGMDQGGGIDAPASFETDEDETESISFVRQITSEPLALSADAGPALPQIVDGEMPPLATTSVVIDMPNGDDSGEAQLPIETQPIPASEVSAMADGLVAEPAKTSVPATEQLVGTTIADALPSPPPSTAPPPAPVETTNIFASPIAAAGTMPGTPTSVRDKFREQHALRPRSSTDSGLKINVAHSRASSQASISSRSSATPTNAKIMRQSSAAGQSSSTSTQVTSGLANNATAPAVAPEDPQAASSSAASPSAAAAANQTVPEQTLPSSTLRHSESSQFSTHQQHYAPRASIMTTSGLPVNIKTHPIDIKVWIRRTWTIEFCSM
ncbi:hypothetical protein DFS34DRAFT_495016 [Phlyctochytrium arcticum]|nr:hypothetical protein DFS34DRAFT_495016 [Phlyctochytrium arcticum]